MPPYHDDDIDPPDDLTSGLPPDHSIECYESDNPVVAVLLGPDGEVLVEVRERATVRFGFRGSGDATS